MSDKNGYTLSEIQSAWDAVVIGCDWFEFLENLGSSPPTPEKQAWNGTKWVPATTDDDFEHFLSYAGLWEQPAEVIALLRRAYWHGAGAPGEPPAPEIPGMEGTRAALANLKAPQ